MMIKKIDRRSRLESAKSNVASGGGKIEIAEDETEKAVKSYEKHIR